MKTNSQQSFLFRFKIQFKTVSTTYTVQVVSIDLQQYMLNSNTSTTAVQTKDATWCIWEIKINVPKQAVSTCHLTLTPLSTNNLNTKFHCAFSAMTVPISLSLSTPVPILPGKQQCFRLQSPGYQSVQTSVKPHCSCTLSNLRCSTTHIFISQMWQINQGHWQSKLDPPGSHAKVSLSNYHLQAWRQAQ